MRRFHMFKLLHIFLRLRAIALALRVLRLRAIALALRVLRLRAIALALRVLRLRAIACPYCFWSVAGGCASFAGNGFGSSFPLSVPAHGIHSPTGAPVRDGCTLTVTWSPGLN